MGGPVSDDVADAVMEREFRQAMHAIRLNLPSADASLLESAGEAVRREYLDSVKWKRLRCRSVHVLSESPTGTIYVLHVGSSVEFDWTWEGATAFRPLFVEESVAGTKPTFADTSSNVDDRYQLDVDDSVLWSGEVLEVDEAAGKIYVSVSNPELPPTTGSFFVKPFEFLAFLHAVFHDPAYDSFRQRLRARLLAATGGVHPQADGYRSVGEPSLRDWWRRSWSILWGPPGTGKTYTTGQHVAGVLEDASERVLVVSTTNKATDGVAISIGRAAKILAAKQLANGQLLRIGKGASWWTFDGEDLTGMLKGTEAEFLIQIEERAKELSAARNSEAKAMLRQEVKNLRKQMRDAAQRNFLNDDVRVVVCTAFRATTFLKSEDIKDAVDAGFAPFTTVVIDEAGLISRAACAALSLLASRRVVLVGDSKQLAPISRISRLLPTDQRNWLASSGVSHLQSMSTSESGVRILTDQYRMHPEICSVVSRYQYEGALQTAPAVLQRQIRLPELLADQSRTIWYVMDEAGEDLPTIRAERGPGNRSWVRQATLKILARLFFDLEIRNARGIFVSPFKAQVKHVSAFFALNKIDTWSASTVHSQQGSEADLVIFDTVNAGSYSWPYDEWKRLVNVAISRARETVILMASRAEMAEPYLQPLLDSMAPLVLRKNGDRLEWQEVPVTPQKFRNGGSNTVSSTVVKENNSIGYQISSRKELRPILSQEQQRLCGLELDGKPRLVRGVAGSGKTVVLANWLAQTVKRLGRHSDARVWVVFANRSLQSLIGDAIQSAWSEATDGQPFPWDQITLHHVRELLAVMLPEVGLSLNDFGFDYDAAAEAYLRIQNPHQIKYRCDALFVDEAQDMGPNTLKLLSSIVSLSSDRDANSRSVNVFYDNAQNIYGRETPVWSELGLDMRGRSTVMKESFRSTRPITEFALNVLYRLQPPHSSVDHKELVARGLIEPIGEFATPWWKIRFNQIDGPKPLLFEYSTADQQFREIVNYVQRLVEVEDVQPEDIAVIYNGAHIRNRLETQVAEMLNGFGVELSVQTNKPFARNRNTVIATTPHSFKGYDAEVVIIPAVNQFFSSSRHLRAQPSVVGESANHGILANSLYVAMTRARSILSLFASPVDNENAVRLQSTIKSCLDLQSNYPQIEHDISLRDDLMDLLEIIGGRHRKWLLDLSDRFALRQEPLCDDSGRIRAEPLFWFRTDGGSTFACFCEPLEPMLVEWLSRSEIVSLPIGGDVPS